MELVRVFRTAVAALTVLRKELLDRHSLIPAAR
jgi:hypothetical protein